ncbi:MAG: D-alanyl-D-alanine carboxypeptidase [Lachnospiraceae bacterium]|nr:D-alanyl-D-alanine carboxypeptidase [Lachnospiraceae bacterium]
MKKLVSFVLIFFLVFQLITPVYAEELNENQLYSLSAAMIDGNNGRLLYGKNPNEQRAMASTTKIMTLILALEYGNLEDIITVSSYASKMPDVQLGIKEGEQYKLGDLVYSMMLESHNDVAVAIAEHVGGDLESFINMMNKKAMEIGLSNTYFLTPNGLDMEDESGKHSSTAYEMCLIMKYCVMDSPMKEEFMAICQTRQYTFSDYNNKRTFTVDNKNALLDKMDNVLAGKTGFTVDAGYCYVCAVSYEDKVYIVALLGCGWPNNKGYKWKDVTKLIDYGKSEFEYVKIIDRTYDIGEIKVIDGIQDDKTKLYVTDEIELLLCKDDKVDIICENKDVIYAPVTRGDVVKKLNIYINDEFYTSVNVYAEDSIDKIDLSYWVYRIFDMYF